MQAERNIYLSVHYSSNHQNLISESDISEIQLQERWENLPFPAEFLALCGTTLLVLDGGSHNLNAGPDFLNALILAGDEIIHGDVELHLRRTGWRNHGHADDPRYKNVVLHVLAELSPPLQHESEPRFTIIFPRDAESGSVTVLPALKRCEYDGVSTGATEILESLGWQRIHNKARALSKKLQVSRPVEVWYRQALRVLGYSQNTDFMQKIVDRLPLERAMEIVLHATPEQLAGFVLGISGAADHFDISVPFWEEVMSRYKISGMQFSEIKPLRSRPQNHPLLRLLVFLRCLPKWLKLLHPPGEEQDANKYIALLTSAVRIPERYSAFFPENRASLGRIRATELIVNLYLPFWLARPKTLQRQALRTWAARFPAIPAYSNIRDFIVTSGWNNILPEKNLHPILLQGLLYLRHHYCSENLCEICPALQEESP